MYGRCAVGAPAARWGSPASSGGGSTMPEKSPAERGISRREALTGAVVLGSAPVLLGAAGGMGAAGADTPGTGAHRPGPADQPRMLARISGAHIQRTNLTPVALRPR